jgi:hypothetical protein
MQDMKFVNSYASQISKLKRPYILIGLDLLDRVF